MRQRVVAFNERAEKGNVAWDILCLSHKAEEGVELSSRCNTHAGANRPTCSSPRVCSLESALCVTGCISVPSLHERHQTQKKRHFWEVQRSYGKIPSQHRYGSTSTDAQSGIWPGNWLTVSSLGSGTNEQDMADSEE